MSKYHEYCFLKTIGTVSTPFYLQRNNSAFQVALSKGCLHTLKLKVDPSDPPSFQPGRASAQEGELAANWILLFRMFNLDQMMIDMVGYFQKSFDASAAKMVSILFLLKTKKVCVFCSIADHPNMQFCFLSESSNSQISLNLQYCSWISIHFLSAARVGVCCFQ